MNKESGFFGGISTGLFFGAYMGDVLLGGMTGLVLATTMQSIMTASGHREHQLQKPDAMPYETNNVIPLSIRM